MGAMGVGGGMGAAGGMRVVKATGAEGATVKHKAWVGNNTRSLLM